MDKDSQEVIEKILNGIGGLVIINSGLSMFTETLQSSNKKDIENFILNVSSNFDQKLKEIQDTLLKIESIEQEIFEVIELYILDNNQKRNIFLMPMNRIKRVVVPKETQLKGAEQDCLLIEDNAYSIIDLEDLFFENKDNHPMDSVIIVTTNNIALKLTETGKTKQIVSKNISDNMGDIENFSGAAFNGLGGVELIIEPDKIKDYLKIEHS